MERDDIAIPRCPKCNSKQIRTTKTHHICIRCGNKEVVEHGIY